jgi:hypothetical protein
MIVLNSTGFVCLCRFGLRVACALRHATIRRNIWGKKVSIPFYKKQEKSAYDELRASYTIGKQPPSQRKYVY